MFICRQINFIISCLADAYFKSNMFDDNLG